MLQLSVQLPEMDMLLVLLSQIELWQIRCNEFLRGPITLKELEVVLQDADNFTVNIPELKLLRQYHSNALSWIRRFHESLVNIQDREDYNVIVEELTSILEAGESLRVHVDQLPHVKAEFRKSRCREKAFMTLTIQMPLEFIQELMKEAALLQITKEKLFMDVSRVLEEASSWEESARHLLCSMGQMFEFEDALRASESIFAQLPSLQDVKDALSMAESWIRASQPFLMSTVCSGHALNPLLKVDALNVDVVLSF